MKCSHEVIVEKPIQEVWDYANNPDNLTLWLNDFIRYEHLTGDPNNPKAGDTSNYTFDENGKEFTMLEEIIAITPPTHVKLLMTSKSFDMEVVNDFESRGASQTKLTASAKMTRVGFFTKIMMKIFMPQAKMQADHEVQINKLKALIEAS